MDYSKMDFQKMFFFSKNDFSKMDFRKSIFENGFYKIFRIDRIEGWFPTKVKWVKPAFNFDSSIPPINPNGHKLFRKIYKVVSTQQETPQQTLQQEPQQTTNV
jgi:hypothetical protein